MKAREPAPVDKGNAIMHQAEAIAYLKRVGASYGDVSWSFLVDNMSEPGWGTTLTHDELWDEVHDSDAIKVTATPTGEVAFRLRAGIPAA